MLLDVSLCQFDDFSRSLSMTLPWNNLSMQVMSWEEGCKVVTCSFKEIPFDDIPDVPILSAFMFEGMKEHPLRRYAESVPTDVACQISKSPYDQLTSLRLCAVSERARQLLMSAPVLFWYVAPEILRRSTGKPDQVNRLLGMRRRELLGLVCDGASKAHIRLLSRFPLPDLSFDCRSILQLILSAPDVIGLLGHVETIDWALCQSLLRYRDAILTKVGRSLLCSKLPLHDKITKLRDLKQLLDDVIMLGTALNIKYPEIVAQACRDWNNLFRLHEKWSERVNKADFEDMIAEIGNDLPLPPFSGCQGIEPISTVLDLLEEGSCMHHCVGSYVEKIRSGHSYIYKVTFPERSTLELRRYPGKHWHIGQAKGYCNHNVSMETTKYIQKWLTNRLK